MSLNCFDFKPAAYRRGAAGVSNRHKESIRLLESINNFECHIPIVGIIREFNMFGSLK